jgi:hypothetical protein
VARPARAAEGDDGAGDGPQLARLDHEIAPGAHDVPEVRPQAFVPAIGLIATDAFRGSLRPEFEVRVRERDGRLDVALGERAEQRADQLGGLLDRRVALGCR